MNLRVSVIVAALIAALAMGATGCSGPSQGGSAQTGPSTSPIAPAGQFKGRDLRDVDELEQIAEKAIARADEAEEKAEDADLDEVDANDDVAKAFSKANSQYNKGDYAGAEKGYEDVLADHPLHFGANVNLSLAKLQQQNDEDALLQSLICLALFPDDAGCILNVQAAAAACGFGMADLEDVMKTVMQHNGSATELTQLKGKHGEYAGYYEYNVVWSAIDSGLYLVNSGEMDYDEGLADLVDELEHMEKLYSDDEQVEQLHAYLDAAMRQLGMS